ncbi:hypothetical protein RND71_010665 [Anisodus tanguticus]|uniref:Uncharacterized protein n=1 Tax=Anisodus tanguticus TaxID=243964 RepID=A0AAE1SJP0_9SOLA|nr:hypothetical protein RND71_010665 [Anisodus tanguticus]
MEQIKGNNIEYGVIVHSQVRKIRQEMEKIQHPSLQQPEITGKKPEMTGKRQHERSRSPLGLAQRWNLPPQEPPHSGPTEEEDEFKKIRSIF